jgi:hypothetical protein
MNKKEKDSSETEQGQKTIYRIFIGGLIGFVLGFLVGLIFNPPFSGMFNTSADVQGLTMFNWVMCGYVGSIICSILSLFWPARKNRSKGKL